MLRGSTSSARSNDCHTPRPRPPQHSVWLRLMHNPRARCLTQPQCQNILFIQKLLTERLDMELSDVQQRFILHWGEMGTRWGINRSVAQIHALLLMSPDPLNAEQIAETLSLARSNVSTSLKELQGWRLLRISHKLGDRKDYFTTLDDVWEMARTILEERKRREIDPTTEVLRECIEQSKSDASEPPTAERLQQLLDFIETVSTWHDQVHSLSTPAFVQFAKAGSKVGQLFGLKANKKTPAKKKA